MHVFSLDSDLPSKLVITVKVVIFSSPKWSGLQQLAPLSITGVSVSCIRVEAIYRQAVLMPVDR